MYSCEKYKISIINPNIYTMHNIFWMYSPNSRSNFSFGPCFLNDFFLSFLQTLNSAFTPWGYYLVQQRICLMYHSVPLWSLYCSPCVHTLQLFHYRNFKYYTSIYCISVLYCQWTGNLTSCPILCPTNISSLLFYNSHTC